jgi:hypothetical protein
MNAYPRLVPRPVTRGQMAAFLRRILAPVASPSYPAP